MKKYGKFLDDVKESKKLFELAINPEKIEKIERLKNAKDFKSILKLYNEDIEKIKDALKNINYDDIKIEHDEDCYIVKYNNMIYTLLKAFEAQIFNLDDELVNKIFNDGYQDLFLEITLDQNNLNKIDILNGLPIFMKNIGLGKKIYKKLIKKINYVSSFYGYEPSIDSDMTWLSILNDKEIYSFINDNNIISFWNEYEYGEIIEKLKLFYEHDGVKTFDDDFLLRYNLTDKKIEEILTKQS
jgi:hypothetical protein